MLATTCCKHIKHNGPCHAGALFKEHKMIYQGKVLASLLLMFGLTTVFTAQGESESTTTKDVMERIEVHGSLPKQFYRDRLFQAEQRFFDLFNQLTTDDAYKVTCKRRKQHAFTRLTQRICEANFVSDIKHENYDRVKSMQSASSNTVSLGNKAKYRRQYKEMLQKQAQHMAELINSNEQLREQFAALQHARKKYDQYDDE
jgi:hypothetical protein